MKERGLEDIIKDKLYDQELQAPDLFEAIQQKRSAWVVFGNKLKFHKWKVLGAAALMLLVSWAVFDQIGDNSNSIVENEVSNSHINNEEGTTPNVNEVEIVGEGDQDRSPELDSEINETITEDESVSVDQSSDVVAESSREQEFKNNDIASTDQSPGQAGEAGEDDTANPASSSGESNTKEEESTPSVEDTDSDRINPIEVADVEEQDSDKDRANKSPSEEDIDLPIATIDESEDTDDKVVTPDNTEDPIAGLEEKTEESVGEEDDIIEPNIPTKKWSIGAAYSSAYATKFLSGASDQVSYREKSESPAYAYGMRFNVNYEVQNNIEVYSGVRYHNRTDRHAYEYERQVENTRIEERQVTVIDPLGETKTITVKYPITESVNVKVRNEGSLNYQRLMIPLGLRYSHHFDHVSFSPSLEVGVQVWSRNSGTIVIPDMSEKGFIQDPRSIALDAAPYQRKSLSTDARIGLGMQVRLNKRWSVVVEPSYTMFISPSTGKEYAIRQRDYSIDLNTGLKFNF